jgi:putative copper resistance protein D
MVRSRSGRTRPNTPAEKAWSEYNHHWAGLIVLAIGLLALLAQLARASWARNWPSFSWVSPSFYFSEAIPKPGLSPRSAFG